MRKKRFKMKSMTSFIIASILFYTPLLLGTEQTGTKPIQVEALLISAPDSLLKDLGISADLKKMLDRKELDYALSQKIGKGRNIRLFSYPTVNVLEGAKGSLNDTYPVQYMEKQENGLFALKTYEEQVGSIFEVTANVDGDYITVDVNFKVSRLKERVRIEGVRLDIGYPIIESAGVHTSVRLKNGEVVLLSRKSSDLNIILIFLTARIL